MDFLLDALTEWLKEMLVGGIMGNLSGMFDSVNQQVGDISVQVGQTPQGWNGGIFNMIQNLSNSIMVPIAGVILAIVSYLAEKEQRILYDAMGHADCTPSLAQAIKMKSFSREGKLSEAVIRSIMAEEKPNQKEQFRIPKERISKYFKPGTPARTMEDTIIKALDYYRKRQREIER